MEYTGISIVDSLLFSLYYLVNRFPVAIDYIQTNVKSLYESIDLMKNGYVNMARIRMIQTTGAVDIYSKKTNVIDVTSTIGGWLYYFKTLVKFDILTNVTCTNCKMSINKTKMLLSIDMERITRDIQSEITKRSEESNIRDCGTVDEIIDLTNDANSNSETKCDEKMTTSTQYQNAPWLLTILSSTNTGTNLLFNELPTVVRMCEKIS